MVAWPFKIYLGAAAAVIILIGLAAISLLLMFNTLIVNFFSIHKKFITRLGVVGRGIFSVVRRVTVPAEVKEETGDEETYEDDEVSDLPETLTNGEEPERFVARRVHSLNSTTEDEAAGEDIGAEIEEEESIKTAAAGTSTTAGPWAQKVIIKELPPVSLLESKRDKPTSGDINANKNIIQ